VLCVRRIEGPSDLELNILLTVGYHEFEGEKD